MSNNSEHPSSEQGPPRHHAAWHKFAAGLVAASLLGVAGIVAVEKAKTSTPVAEPRTTLQSTQWIPAAVSFAQSIPRLLVTEPGWNVTYADQLGTQDAEIHFAKQQQKIEIHWRPGSSYEDYLQDRQASAEKMRPLQTTPLAGSEATTFLYTGNRGDYTSLAQMDGSTVEVRGTFASLDDYLHVVASIKTLGVDEWLSAMPAAVVKPSARAQAIDDILRGMPLPDGLDVQPLKDANTISDPYQLSAQVVARVGCKWVETWLSATTANDTAKSDAAEHALVDIKNSQVLRTMANEGAYPEVFGQIVDEVQHGRASSLTADNAQVDNGGEAPTGDKKPLANYQSALGCEAN